MVRQGQVPGPSLRSTLRPKRRWLVEVDISRRTENIVGCSPLDSISGPPALNHLTRCTVLVKQTRFFEHASFNQCHVLQ
jgi:hypothetical protein